MRHVVVKAGEEPDIVAIEAGMETELCIWDWNAYRGAPIEYVYELTWEPEIGREALTGELERVPFSISPDMVVMRRQFELENCVGIVPINYGCAFKVRITIDKDNATGLLGFKAHTASHQFRGKVRVTTLPSFAEMLAT